MQYRQMPNNRRHKTLKLKTAKYLKGYNEIIIYLYYLFIHYLKIIIKLDLKLE